MTRMHFDIDFFGDGIKHLYFHGHGHFPIDFNEVILDPSVLYYLTSHKINETQIIYYLPDNLIRLIDRSKQNDEYRYFLDSFLTYFRYPFGKRIQEEDWTLFYENIGKMTIKTISLDNLQSEQEDNYYESYLELFSDHDFYISMSPMINFLGDCIAKIMEFSMRTGKIILSKSRKLANLLREKVISLELPKRFDNAVLAKSELLNNMFNFQGGRATRFFIGISISVGGFIHPAIGAIGVVFAFMDP